jgi:hypothetical protein
MLRQIDPRVPSSLPPAKLYLDDIEQITQILVESEQEHGEQLPQNPELEISFRIHNQTTNDIQDLSNLHPDFTNDFYVEVRRGSRFVASVTIYKSYTAWYAYGLTESEDWALFHKLDTFFEARRLRWKKLLHAHSKVSNWIFGAASALFLTLLPTAFIHRVPRTPVIASIVVLAILLISLRNGLSSHSVVIFHHRADHAVRRQGGVMKVVLEISKIIIVFLLGVLSMYLKHKYWP